MTRTAAREIAVHFSYELGFAQTSAGELMDARLKKEVFANLAEEEPLYGEFPGKKQQEYIRTLVSGVGEHAAELDAYIEKYAVGWRFSRISRVAAAIMRVAMYELLYMPEIPAAAAINEAVELSKNYEEPETSAFINGILGSFVRAECALLRPEAGKKTPVKPSGSNSGEAKADAGDSIQDDPACSPVTGADGKTPEAEEASAAPGAKTAVPAANGDNAEAY